MIADPRLSRAWSALRRVLAAAADPGPLPEAVNAELAGDGGEAPSLVDLHALTAEVPSAANADWYARQVIDAHVRRTAASTSSTDGRQGSTRSAALAATCAAGIGATL